MAKFVCLLVCLAVLVNTGLALKCYSCRAEKQEDCIKARKEVECSKVAASVPVCYSVQTPDEKAKLVWDYNCGAVSEGKTVDTSNLPNCLTANAKDCKVCKDNLCNGGSTFTMSLVSLLCLPVLFLVNKFVLH